MAVFFFFFSSSTSEASNRRYFDLCLGHWRLWLSLLRPACQVSDLFGPNNGGITQQTFTGQLISASLLANDNTVGLAAQARAFPQERDNDGESRKAREFCQLIRKQQTYAASASAASIVFNRCSNVDDVLGSVLWDGLENWRAVTPGRNFNELSLISFEMAPLLFAFASATLGSWAGGGFCSSNSDYCSSGYRGQWSQIEFAPAAACLK